MQPLDSKGCTRRQHVKATLVHAAHTGGQQASASVNPPFTVFWGCQRAQRLAKEKAWQIKAHIQQQPRLGRRPTVPHLASAAAQQHEQHVLLAAAAANDPCFHPFKIFALTEPPPHPKRAIAPLPLAALERQWRHRAGEVLARAVGAAALPSAKAMPTPPLPVPPPARSLGHAAGRQPAALVEDTAAGDAFCVLLGGRQCVHSEHVPWEARRLKLRLAARAHW